MAAGDPFIGELKNRLLKRKSMYGDVTEQEKAAVEVSPESPTEGSTVVDNGEKQVSPIQQIRNPLMGELQGKLERRNRSRTLPGGELISPPKSDFCPDIGSQKVNPLDELRLRLRNRRISEGQSDVTQPQELICQKPPRPEKPKISRKPISDPNIIPRPVSNPISVAERPKSTDDQYQSSSDPIAIEDGSECKDHTCPVLIDTVQDTDDVFGSGTCNSEESSNENVIASTSTGQRSSGSNPFMEELMIRMVPKSPSTSDDTDQWTTDTIPQLTHEAALHKISIRPRKTHSQTRRGSSQVSQEDQNESSWSPGMLRDSVFEEIPPSFLSLTDHKERYEQESRLEGQPNAEDLCRCTSDTSDDQSFRTPAESPIHSPLPSFDPDSNCTFTNALDFVNEEGSRDTETKLEQDEIEVQQEILLCKVSEYSADAEQIRLDAEADSTVPLNVQEILDDPIDLEEKMDSLSTKEEEEENVEELLKRGSIPINVENEFITEDIGDFVLVEVSNSVGKQ